MPARVHGAVVATAETLAIMAARYGDDFAGSIEALSYGQAIQRNAVEIALVPASHILGSAQAVVRHKGVTIVVSGDYKCRRNPTCPAFEPVRCDVFVTEATFGIPMFNFPHDGDEIARLLKSVAQFPERTHLVGAYALGKAAGVFPLAITAGAGAGGQNDIGTGIIGGMLTATVLAIFFVLLFFALVREYFSKTAHPR